MPSGIAQIVIAREFGGDPGLIANSSQLSRSGLPARRGDRCASCDCRRYAGLDVRAVRGEALVARLAEPEEAKEPAAEKLSALKIRGGR